MRGGCRIRSRRRLRTNTPRACVFCVFLLLLSVPSLSCQKWSTPFHPARKWQCETHKPGGKRSFRAPFQADVMGTSWPTTTPSTSAVSRSPSNASESVCHPPPAPAAPAVAVAVAVVGLSGPERSTVGLTLSRCSSRQCVELMMRQLPTIGDIFRPCFVKKGQMGLSCSSRVSLTHVRPESVLAK